MELALPQGDSLEPRLARVTKPLKDSNGIPIGTADQNPLLDTHMYEVEFADGEKASLAANYISASRGEGTPSPHSFCKRENLSCIQQ